MAVLRWVGAGYRHRLVGSGLQRRMVRVSVSAAFAGVALEIMASSATTQDAAPAPAVTGDDPPAPDGWPSDLASLRAKLDGLDDGIHDLLMRRAEIVGALAASRLKTPGVALRPGREAQIIRRLLGRHHGNLPPASVVRIWRELLAATTAMQGAHVIAVCETDPGGGYTQVAREHFGALTAMRVHSSPAQALADVSSGNASAAVLPMPSETETPRAAWWTALLHKDEPRIHVIARLPFWAPRPEGAPALQAMVIAAFAPDRSGIDRSRLGLVLARDVTRARLTAAVIAAGLRPEQIILRRDQGAQVAHALVEVDGDAGEGDPRLDAIGALLRRPVALGAYAVPVDAGTGQNTGSR
jgi:chorismate mutase/prephenate dehydratase